MAAMSVQERRDSAVGNRRFVFVLAPGRGVAPAPGLPRDREGARRGSGAPALGASSQLTPRSRRAEIWLGKKAGVLERLASLATAWAGGSWAFALALGVILLWVVTGPLFGFSDTWQLVINTGTTIVTFLMVFLIQRSQNKDAHAIQLKLNELVAALQGASNRLINVEDLTEKEVETLHRHYGKLADLAKGDEELTQCHSIEEAEGRHRAKQSAKRSGKGSHPGKTDSGQASPS